MTLSADEFMRRFLLHVLPRGFQRIRQFGLLANRRRRELARCRQLLGITDQTVETLCQDYSRSMKHSRVLRCGNARRVAPVL